MMYGTEIRFRNIDNARALFDRLVEAGEDVAIYDGWDDEKLTVYDLWTSARVEYVDGVWVIEGENV